MKSNSRGFGLKMNVKWYNRLVPNPEYPSKRSLLKDTKPELKTIIVCHETTKRTFAKFNSYTSYLDFFDETHDSHKCYYELIFGDFAQKPYFDIDIVLSEPTESKNTTTIESSGYKDTESKDNEPTQSKDTTTIEPEDATPVQVNIVRLSPPKVYDFDNVKHVTILKSKEDELTQKPIELIPINNELQQPNNEISLNSNSSLSGLFDKMLNSSSNVKKEEKKDNPQRKEKFILSSLETYDVVRNLKSCILKLAPCIKDEDIIVMSSNGDKKHSYHIVVDNWCHSDKTEAKAFSKKVVDEMNERWRDAVDTSMHKSIQQFRILGCRKWGSDRVKVINKDLCTWKPNFTPTSEKHLQRITMMASFVSNISYCKYLPRFSEEDVPKSIYTGEEGSLTKETIDAALDLYAIKYNYKPAEFPFTVSSIKGSIVLLKRHCSSYCDVCDRVHENENPYLIITGKDRRIYFDCRRSSSGKKIYVGLLGIDTKTLTSPLTNIKPIEESIVIKQDSVVATKDDHPIIPTIINKKIDVVEEDNNKPHIIKTIPESPCVTVLEDVRSGRDLISDMKSMSSKLKASYKKPTFDSSRDIFRSVYSKI